MPLSERKWLLRIAEYLCLADILACVYCAYHAKLDPIFASSLSTFSFVNSLMVFVLFVLQIFLWSEFSAANNLNQGKEGEDEGSMTFKELSFALQWAPIPIRYSHVLSVGILAYIILFVGNVEWTSGQPFTQRHAFGFMMYNLFFLLLPYSFLASASRMTGSYSQNKIVK